MQQNENSHQDRNSQLRVVFLSDLHFKGKKMKVQTDFGAPSTLIPQRTEKAIKKLQPDCLFVLGDMTAFGEQAEWKNYKKWISKFNIPVFDVFGNHDRNYCVQSADNDGKEYFSELGRVSDTKTIKLGNFVFILLSEENNPAGSKDCFNVTIPQKRINYIKDNLKKYTQKNNVFLLSHTPLAGTTVYSTRWMTNNPQVWRPVSEKLFNLSRKYPLIGHLTGHTHLDYRVQRKVIKLNGEKSRKKRGKFVDGKDYEDLPGNYFLNMPCVDVAHGWLSGRVPPWFLRFDDSYKNWRSLNRRTVMVLDSFGLRFFDWLTKIKIITFLGRSAIYYADLVEGEKSLDIKTHCLENNSTVESYKVKLNKKTVLARKHFEIVDSDLSLRTKKNLSISRKGWFKILGNSNASAEFSKVFPKPTRITGINIEAFGKIDYKCLWKGSKNRGRTWTEKWQANPQTMGKINAVFFKVDFLPNNRKTVVKDILLEHF